MRLSAKALVNWASVNNFDYANQWIIRAGEKNTLYFQLVDLEQCDQLRYVAGVGAGNTPVSLTVTFLSIDSTKVIQAIATQDPNDGSIWSVNLSSSQIPQGGNVKFSLTQGTTIRNFSVLALLGVEYPGNDGSDCSIPNAGY